MAGTYTVLEGSKIKPPTMVYFTKTVHHESYDRISPLRHELSAKGKNVVVTGGGTGIGKAIAISFAEAGADSVSILGRREDRLKGAVEEIKMAATNAASTFAYEVADLMKRDEVDKALQTIVKRVGKLDILVSNAATLPEVAPVATIDTSALMYAFNINVLTALNAVQAFLPLATSSPIILNISTALAHFTPMANTGGYGISKAAALKMMNYLATENPHVHIVNIQPGTVETEMATKAGVKGPDSANLPGNFCVWLASPEARFLKGKFVWSNWDVDELMARSEEIQESRLFTWLLEGVPM